MIMLLFSIVERKEVGLKLVKLSNLYCILYFRV